MKLWYLPLEPYRERYTWFMSCADGWAETHFKNHSIDFERVEGEKLGQEITVGVVLDAFGRPYYAMSQLNNLILRIRAGDVQDDDVIYTEDFWHPGIESLFYIRGLSRIKFKVGTFLHAQSVDNSDFTYPMRHWIRDIEKGFSKGFDYIFVTSRILEELCIEAGFAKEHIYYVGLPFNSKRLLTQLKEIGFEEQPKEPFVLFSSRFDEEKNPDFFLDLVEACPDIEFKLVKPRARMSNSPQVERRLMGVISRCNNLEIVNTSEKLDYYELLSRAEIQFNCAYQDWVSWTLLEAITFGCKVLYPDWKDFPRELQGFEETCIYKMNNLEDAIKKLRRLFKINFHESLRSIPQRHDKSWECYLEIMGF